MDYNQQFWTIKNVTKTTKDYYRLVRTTINKFGLLSLDVTKVSRTIIDLSRL